MSVTRAAGVPCGMGLTVIGVVVGVAAGAGAHPERVIANKRKSKADWLRFM